MKKLLFAFATAVLLVAMPKLQVSAQVTTEVIQGLTCTYDDETKTLTVTGEGSLEGHWDQEYNSVSPLDNYRSAEKICMKDVTLVGSAYAGFANLNNLKEITFENVDTSQVTSMGDMFEGCSSLSSLDVSNFDTSKVTYMGGMFDGCSSLSSLDVSNFDTSKVSYMGGMFDGCSSLSSLDVSNFDTSRVKAMWSMFEGCSSLSSLDVSNFDTSQVTNMMGMFRDCSSLSSLDVSNFDTSQVTDMWSMFGGCSSLSSLDVSNFDTSQVTDMRNMFHGCSSLSSLDVSGFDTSQVTSMYLMFYGCSSLSSLDVSSFDTSQVTDMGGIFEGCSSLSSLDLSNFDTAQVTAMWSMFEGCSSLSSLDLSNFDTAQVTSMWSMFEGCSSLSSLDLSSFDTAQVTSMWWMFDDCTNLATIRTPKKMKDTQVIELPGTFWDEQGIEYTSLTTANCGKLLTNIHNGNYTLSTDGIYLMSADSNGFVAGLTTNVSSQVGLEYRWTAYRTEDQKTIVVQDWTSDDCWLNWKPEEYGEYTLTAEARIKAAPSKCVSAQTEAVRYTPYIKGKCQMPYTGEGGGYLIGIETYDNPNQSYTYEMLILDCTLLAEGKDAWIYTTGRCGVAEGNALWTIWQPQYGYYWTLFRVYDANGVMIDQDCYGFVNAY